MLTRSAPAFYNDCDKLAIAPQISINRTARQQAFIRLLAGGPYLLLPSPLPY